MDKSSTVLRLDSVMAKLSQATATTFIELFPQGSLAIEIWTPEGIDTQ